MHSLRRSGRLKSFSTQWLHPRIYHLGCHLLAGAGVDDDETVFDQFPYYRRQTPLRGVDAPLPAGKLEVGEATLAIGASCGESCLALVQPKSGFTGEVTIRAASFVDRTQSH
jgi:hypothetical protein